MILRPSPGFSSRYWINPSVRTAWTWPLTSALPSLAFVWPSNCGSSSLTLITAVRPSRTSSPLRFGSDVLEDAGLAGPVVERRGQRGPEAGDVRAAVDRVDVVGEGEDVLGVGVVVLEGDLDRGLALLALDVDRPMGQDLLVPVQVPHEGHQAALEVERALAIVTLVDERDPDPLVEVGRLAQALGDRLERELRVLEDLGVGPEAVRVPRRVPAGPSLITLVVGLPRAYSWDQTKPSRADSTRIHSDRALTTLTPTPCRPPETL